MRTRRLLAALLCCAAVGIAVQALMPQDAAHTPVVTAGRDLPAGQVLTQGSLAVRPLPADAVPPGVFSSPEELAGRRLASPILAGTPVSETSLVGAGLLAGAPPGTAAVPVRPADPSVLELLRPGQLVDVVQSASGPYGEPGPATVLAAAVPILWTSPAAAGSWPGEDGESGLVVVAAGPNEASALAAASGSLHLVITGPD